MKPFLALIMLAVTVATEPLIQQSNQLFFDALVSPKEKRQVLFSEAKNLLIKAQKSEPKNAEIYASIARIDGQIALDLPIKERVHHAEAIKANALKALSLNPNEPTANLVMGIWEYEAANVRGLKRLFGGIFYGDLPKGDFETSRQYLKKAVLLKPDILFFHLSYAKTLVKLGKIKEAKEELKTAIALPSLQAVDTLYREEAKQLLKRI